jgi:hypothetical protein
MRIKSRFHLRKWFAPFIKGALLALLLFAVPTLATLAKASWYLPQSNPGHYLNIASKMQVRYCSVLFERAPLQTAARLEPPQPPAQGLPEIDSELPKPSIAVTVSVQHRSPPFSSL